MSKHTPGPWLYDLYVGEQESAFVTDANGWRVCGGSNRLTEANARLISASPDLLAALEALVTAPLRYNDATIEIDCKDHADAMRIVREARAAIAKARGTP